MSTQDVFTGLLAPFAIYLLRLMPVCMTYIFYVYVTIKYFHCFCHCHCHFTRLRFMLRYKEFNIINSSCARRSLFHSTDNLLSYWRRHERLIFNIFQLWLLFVVMFLKFKNWVKHFIHIVAWMQNFAHISSMRWHHYEFSWANHWAIVASTDALQFWTIL